MSTEEAPMKPMTDEVVRSLVRNHREFLRFVESRVGNREAAKDIVQEAFARGVDKIESLRNDDSATAWFYRALRNAVIDHYRRNQTAQKALAAFADELETHAEPNGEVRSAVCQCVSRLADTLKPEYADAIAKIEVDGMSVAGYAEQAGISASNAAVRVFRARDALRKRVSQSCGSCATHGCLQCSCGESQV